MSSTPISKDILEALTKYTASLKNKVSLVLQTGEHSKRAELASFLNQICGVSENLLFLERDFKKGARSPLTFFLESNEGLNGISFSGIPSGHEFNSLILAILHSGGSEIKLDQSIKDMLSNVKEELRFETVVSLSCHNCPDVVQALNQFSIISPKISNEMIDGGLYPDLMKERDIQGVPCVYLNGEVFASGKSDIAKLVSKLEELYPYLKPRLSKSLPLQDVAIVGGGPAGISAAIYIARKGLSVALIAEKIGGQVKETMGIENLISVSNTNGDKLTVDMKSHLSDYDVTLKEHLRVTDLRQGAIKKITLSSGEIIEAKTLIIATGAKWRELGVPGEKENIGNGVAYCPHCDGPFFKGKDVAVVGGGNSALEEAVSLTKYASKVTLIHQFDNFQAFEYAVDQAKLNPKIEFRMSSRITEFKGESGLEEVEIESIPSQTKESLKIDGAFIFIGYEPQTEILDNTFVMLNERKEIIVDGNMRTNLEGVYAAGDSNAKRYRQITTAISDGTIAALSALESIQK